MAIRIKKGNEMMQIPVIPLVDTVFNLLIFFLVATKVAEAERDLPVMLPDASEAQAMTVHPNEMVINVNSQGQYFLADQPVTLHDIDMALKMAYVNNHGRTPVIIRSDRRCRWEFVVAALNLCIKNKVHRYHCQTRDPTKGD
jgi:biopolymer transport protein ExbD